MPAPFLSLIIPAYNEQERLPKTLEQALSYLNNQSYEAEILVVENGSQDNTYEIARAFANDDSRVQVIRDVRRGKGLAVKLGMLSARGEYRFMCDADLSMPIEEISHFLPPQSGNIDLAIGSREAPGSVRYNEPLYRHWGGRIVNAMIRLLILPGLHDTQCGFKCFRADIAEDLFYYQTLTGWSFDVEILYLARLRGYQIHEIPILWYFDPETKLKAFKDSIKMYRDIRQIRKNQRCGIYNPR